MDGVARGNAATNVSLIVTHLSTTTFTFSTSSRKITAALFILAADFSKLCPNTSVTAKLQNATE